MTQERLLINNLYKDVLRNCYLKISDETTAIGQNLENEEKMSQSILKIIKHYKQPSPKDLPGATFTDPYPIPDVRQSLGFASSLVFSEMALHGVNNYRIPYIRADIGKMKVCCKFKTPF